MDFTKTILLLSAIVALSSATTTYGDGTVQAEFNVKCSDTHFAVYFNYTALLERTDSTYNNRSFAIHFKDDPTCKTEVNAQTTGELHASVAGASEFTQSTVIGTAFATSNCGINTYSDNDYIFYNTTVIVTYGENPSATVLREEYDNYHVTCLRNRTVEEKLAGDKFDVDKRLTGNEDKNTTALFDLALTHSDMAGVAQSVYQMGDFIKFSMVLNSATAVKGVIQRCWASTAGDKFNNTATYDLIDNRCNLEQKTYWTTAPANKASIFKTEAFRFSTQNEVFVECLVRVCLSTDATSECTLCPAPARKRRAVDDSTSETMTIKSPIFYILERDSTTSNTGASSGSNSALSGTNGLVVIVLVSAFVFVICAAIIKKVFFAAPVLANAPVVAYSNKAMA